RVQSNPTAVESFKRYGIGLPGNAELSNSAPTFAVDAHIDLFNHTLLIHVEMFTSDKKSLEMMLRVKMKGHHFFLMKKRSQLLTETGPVRVSNNYANAVEYSTLA